MRDADVNLYDHDRLKKEFGPFADGAGADIPGRAEHELVGDPYRRMLAETAKIVNYQWRQEIDRSALKGFLFHGGVGVGKTTMGKRLTYELCRLFGDDGNQATRQNEVVLILIDGSDIARGRYGESEEQLAELFQYAREGESHDHHHHEDGPIRRTIMLFDDVESLFLTRSSSGAK